MGELGLSLRQKKETRVQFHLGQKLCPILRKGSVIRIIIRTGCFTTPLLVLLHVVATMAK